MKQGRLVILFSLFLNSLFAQHPVGDKLEQLYFQGHYGLIYRKAKKLRVKEETKSLIAPTYYFALTTLQKSANPYWLKRNLDEPNKAIKLLTGTF